MRTIETKGVIDEQGNLIIPMPADIPQGEHQVVIVIDIAERNASQPLTEAKKTGGKWPPPNFKVFNASLIDPNSTLRREELYESDRG